ncbi:hypothetical protein AD00_5595 [Escherichia coli 2-316-03_S4_C2]|nr:hypothetical protein AD00_5595 [Escherichia coli 2-316-03_S4_C2]
MMTSFVNRHMPSLKVNNLFIRNITSQQEMGRWIKKHKLCISTP